MYTVQYAEILKKPDEYGNMHKAWHVSMKCETINDAMAEKYYLQHCGINIDIEILDDNGNIMDVGEV